MRERGFTPIEHEGAMQISKRLEEDWRTVTTGFSDATQEEIGEATLRIFKAARILRLEMDRNDVINPLIFDRIFLGLYHYSKQRQMGE